MSTKSLVAAKALGGGIAGAGGIVGAGYGITKYFKSEESNVSDQSSQITDETVKGQDNVRHIHSEERGVNSPQEVSQPSPSLGISTGGQLQTEQVDSDESERANNPLPQDSVDNTHENSLKVVSEENRGADVGQQGVSPVSLPDQPTEGKVQTGPVDSKGDGTELTNIADPKSTEAALSSGRGSNISESTDSENPVTTSVTTGDSAQEGVQQ